MRKDVRTTTPEPVHYQLPEGAYLALVRSRDHLKLLARLTHPRVMVDDVDVPVSPMALAQLFDRFAGELDRVVMATRWPGKKLAGTLHKATKDARKGSAG